MSLEAYTPGLKRKSLCSVVKTRRLPIEGEVLVNEGDMVSYDTAVARAMVPGEVFIVKVVVELGLFDNPEMVKNYMQKGEGDTIKKGEVLAGYRAFFGLKHKVCTCPVDGTIDHISTVSGEVVIRSNKVPVEVKSYIPGKVVKVLPKEGVAVETNAAFIQGIFGVGGETHGDIMVISEDPNNTLDAEQITPECVGKVLVGGSLVTGEALKKALDTGVKGIVVGGIKTKDLASFLGYEVGVAITGEEEIGLTLIITEGLGRMKMAQKTFDLMKEFDGKLACINGATQIRAGVIRPEIIIPREGVEASELAEEADSSHGGLEPGTSIRVIEGPYFGSMGHVVSLPPELLLIETESKVRVLEAELEDGTRIVIPRANVEIIE